MPNNFANKIHLFYLAILTIAAIIGLSFVFRKEYKIKTKIFPIYIIFTWVIEIVGFYTRVILKKYQLNIKIYDFYTISEILFIGLFFYFMIDKQGQKKIILFSSLFLFISTVIIILNNLFSQHQVFILGIFIYSIYSLLFLKQLLNLEINLFIQPSFWYVVGFLFFNISFFFLTGLITFVYKRDSDLASKLYSINHVINIIYYSIVTYGFLCQRRLARS
jgi:hypothetical protein